MVLKFSLEGFEAETFPRLCFFCFCDKDEQDDVFNNLTYDIAGYNSLY